MSHDESGDEDVDSGGGASDGGGRAVSDDDGRAADGGSGQAGDRGSGRTGGDDAGDEGGLGDGNSPARTTKRGSTGEPRPNGADLLVECLEREGVEHVFGIPGEELADMLMALKDSSIEFVPVRHEQGAAFMADVHGRLTGEPGVCLSTLGPGATNLLTGVADAHLDKSPLVAITGQGSRERLHKESHQAIDVVDVFESVVKWNHQLDDVDTIAESIRKAFKLARWEKPGATHLELPEDLAAESTDGSPLASRDQVRLPGPDDGAIDAAVEALRAADRPLVLAGNGTVRVDAADRLREFVADTGIPVVSTYMAKGAVSDRDEHSLMTLASGPDGDAGGALPAADCVLAVGYDVAEHDPAGWNPDLEKTMLHLDGEPAEVYEHYNPDVEIVADVATGLQRLTERLDEHWETWCADAHETVREQATRVPEDDEAMTVEGVLPHLRAAMADEDVLVSDVGSHKMAIANRFPVYEPNTCVISNGLASMGIAVPGGVAADLAVDAEVVVATGDGGFLMNAAELDTAGRLDCSFTTIVFVDDEYRLITDEFEELVGDTYGTELTNPDFVTFAQSFGVDAHRVADYDEFRTRVDDALESDGLSLLAVPVSYD